jgi:6-phosphogluconolactonase
MGTHGLTPEPPPRPRGRRAHLGHRVRRAVAVTAALAGLVAAAGVDVTGPVPADASAAAARSVYVTNSQNVATEPGPATIARFTIRPDGQLAPAETVVATRGVRGMVFAPDRRHAYVSSSQTNEISVFELGPGGELGGQVGAVPAGGPFGITISPDGDTVYVAEQDANQVAAFGVQPDGGLVRQDTEVTAVVVPKDVAVTPDGRFLYVSHGDFSDQVADAVSGFELEADGDLGRPLPPVPAGASGAEIMVTPDGRFVYVVHQISSEVVGYRIGRNGQLTEVARLRPSTYIEGAAVSPDGRMLYAGTLGVIPPSPNFPPDPERPSAMLAFRIGTGGALTLVARVPTADPVGMAFGPDGRRLYVSSYTRNEVTTFAVQPSGGLTPLQTLPSGGPRPSFQSVSVPSH